MQEREFRMGRDQTYDRPIQYELIYARIEILLVASTSNELALKLRGQGAWPVYTDISQKRRSHNTTSSSRRQWLRQASA